MKRTMTRQNDMSRTSHQMNPLWAVEKYVSNEHKRFIPVDELREQMFGNLLQETFGDDYKQYLSDIRYQATISQMIRSVDDQIAQMDIEDGGITLIDLEGARELAAHSPSEHAMEILAWIEDCYTDLQS